MAKSIRDTLVPGLDPPLTYQQLADKQGVEVKDLFGPASSSLSLLDAVPVVGDIYETVSGEKTREAQTDAQNKALAAEQDAIDKQIVLINENKAESKILIDDLDKFLTENNTGIEKELLTANTESSRILLESSLAAFNTSLTGSKDHADELLKTVALVSDALKVGNRTLAKELSSTATSAADTLVTGVEGSSLAELKSINTASEASQAATDEITESFTPWIQGGVWANQELQDSYEELTRAFTIDDFQKEGGYDLRLNQALDTITNRASALGVTGGTTQDLVEYSQDFASLEYGKAYDRFNLDQQDKIGYLAGLSSGGLRATETVGGYREREAGRQTGFELSRGDIESGRISSIADIVSQKQLALGEIEASRLGEDTRIEAARIGARGDISASRIASDADLRSRYDLTKGQLESGEVAREGDIRANILQQGGRTATNLASMRMANQNQTSANLISAEGAIGSSLSSYYTNIGDIQSNYYQNFNNMLNTLVNTGVAAYGSGAFDKKPPTNTSVNPVSRPSTTVQGSQNYLTNPDNFNFSLNP